MEYDNERDRLIHGYDAGNIIDGVVVYDENLKRYVLIDDEGVGFDVQAALKSLNGKQIRMTMISFESIQTLENLMANTGGSPVMVESSSDSNSLEYKE